MRGRLPDTAEAHRLRGSARSRNQQERPGPAAGKPACPKWLDREAKREWRRVVGELVRLGVATKLDKAVLAVYAASWSEWKQATERLQAEGPTYQSARLEKASPLVGVAGAAAARMIDAADRLAMTPAGRRRLGLAAPRPESGPSRLKARFFGGESG
jgi:P27 family predicted phage terminase small subunit